MTQASALFSLAGRTALVTGAGRGLGRAMALHLAAAGAQVWVTGRHASALEECCAMATARGGVMNALVMDVRALSSIEAAFSTVAASGQPLDILLNNAGDEKLCASDAVDEALWDQLLDTNLRGAFFVAQRAARLMGSGASIVNLASLAAATGIARAVPYSASKSGILGMTRSLAVEWAPRGIRVNALAPGYFHTAMTAPFFEDATWQEKMRARIPLGRFGIGEDLAGPLQFLCSDASAYVTGQTLYVDGGALASL
ncbi:SDR family oxidoreductase [Asaia sp. VD9]|uniref:SDR family NAD(P)-dependent oxidoreductase n=1 Tax=Asaia sp. VD9 TaxID=3081235 RepID=UPI003017A89D